ncbi:MAG: hypothetical protein HC773_03225 [Scytonema sp. CRU_2_7]|nr:hypothetical protein [Scytonema sp. CRU_2_7]
MAKALYLAGLFLVGCIASSLLAWFGTLHPGNLRIAIALYALMIVIWGLCWLLDDAIAPYFKVPHLNYYAFLIGFGVAVVLGSVATWLTN